MKVQIELCCVAILGGVCHGRMMDDEQEGEIGLIFNSTRPDRSPWDPFDDYSVPAYLSRGDIPVVQIYRSQNGHFSLLDIHHSTCYSLDFFRSISTKTR